jgi:hypothetical protein
VFIIQAADVAMTVSSLHCVSVDPPWISVALSKDARKSAAILRERRFSARQLRQGEKNAAYTPQNHAGNGLIEIECLVGAVHPVGDHYLVLAEVQRVTTDAGRPLLHWRHGFFALDLQYPFLESAETMSAFVRDWESGTLPKEQWTHAAHVAVGAYYAAFYSDDALNKMRAGIFAFNASVGTLNTDSSGYHETLTVFWASIIRAAVCDIADPWKAAQRAVSVFGEDRDLHRLYYSFDVVASASARKNAVSPDRQGPYPYRVTVFSRQFATSEGQ